MNKQNVNILFLDQDDIQNCGGSDMDLYISTIEEVFKLHAKQDYLNPDKTVLRWGDAASEISKGRYNCMPGYIGGKFNTPGVKWIASFPTNPSKYNLPRASGLLIINNPDNGLPLAIMDGTLISAMRTGASTGIAARYLAKKDSQIIGLIGAGVQNRTQVMAITAVMPNISTVKVYDIQKQRAINFADDMEAKLGLKMIVTDSPADAVMNSDIIVSATVAMEPIVKDAWLMPGSFYSHVGSFECEFDVVRKSDKVIVDDWNAVLHRAIQPVAVLKIKGEISDSAIYSELGKIVIGEKKGRENDTERILYNPIGMGILDLAVAKIIYEEAKEKRVGRSLPIWSSPFFV